jgi:hypothetical protein
LCKNSPYIGMKKLFLAPFTLLILTSCFEVKKLEIDPELQRQLDVSKPVVIGPAEVSGVAQEIGDSLLNTIQFANDTSFKVGKHSVKIYSKGNSKLGNSASDLQIEAFEYSLSQDPKFKPKGIVSYKRTDEVASYQNFKVMPSATIKLIEIAIDLEEVNFKVVHSRRK